MSDAQKPWAWEGVDVGDLCGLGPRDTLKLGDKVLELRRPEEWSPRERYRFERLRQRSRKWDEWVKHAEQDGDEAEQAAAEAMERADAEADRDAGVHVRRAADRHRARPGRVACRAFFDAAGRAASEPVGKVLPEIDAILRCAKAYGGSLVDWLDTPRAVIQAALDGGIADRAMTSRTPHRMPDAAALAWIRGGARAPES